MGENRGPGWAGTALRAADGEKLRAGARPGGGAAAGHGWRLGHRAVPRDRTGGALGPGCARNPQMRFRQSHICALRTRFRARERTRCGVPRAHLVISSTRQSRYEVATSFVGQGPGRRATFWALSAPAVPRSVQKQPKRPVLGALSRSGCRRVPKMHVGCTRLPPMHPEAPRNRENGTDRGGGGTRRIPNSRASPPGAHMRPDLMGHPLT
jgi:hypothetical protein